MDQDGCSRRSTVTDCFAPLSLWGAQILSRDRPSPAPTRNVQALQLASGLRRPSEEHPFSLRDGPHGHRPKLRVPCIIKIGSVLHMGLFYLSPFEHCSHAKEAIGEGDHERGEVLSTFFGLLGNLHSVVLLWNLSSQNSNRTSSVRNVYTSPATD